ncbi:MAG: gamma-glutamyl-gamma-aminobutyrate hydrolase family protein, partial [Betaproteobacteria bacterium]
RAFVAQGEPVLGVCRGAQIINVAQGGTLYQDIATQRPDALNHRNWALYEQNCHATALVAKTPLAKLYPGITLIKTNSIHHQAVKDLGRELVVEAWSEPDRLVEALRWTGGSYLFGVQWHPEFHDPTDPSFVDDTPILDDFLAAAANHKAAAYAL